MFVSVYTIAKNEEQVAARWYDCFKEADEVCVLVNNSTDQTAEILRGLGAKVVEKTYKDFRFDVARNEAMKMCSHKADLLFGCDMDDVIENGWKQRIERAWALGQGREKEPNSILFTYSVWYGDEVPLQKFLRHSIHTPSGWYWKCRVHEYLEHTTEKNFIYYPKFEMQSRPTRHEHSNYLSMIEDECRDPKCEARNKHLLGREYLQHKRYEDAIEWFNEHLESVDANWKSERAASMKFLSDCYGSLGFENAKELWLWKAMYEDPNDRDAPFVLGMLLIKKKQYRTAIDVLERCLAIEKPELDYPFFSLDSWTERPIVCLAEAKFYVGEWAESITLLNQALEMNPKCDVAKTMKEEIEGYISEGRKPPLPPSEVHRYRIEVPELA